MEKLVLAIQKGGRLNEGSLVLLKSCGIRLSQGSRKLKAESPNFPIEVLFLRDDDIPQYVAEGVADAGILGEDVCLESGKEMGLMRKLGFARCRLSLAIPREQEYSGLKWFEGKRIATSYPLLLQSFLDKNRISAQIEYLSGSVEIGPSIGLSDAICDIVSSGSTLVMNGLVEVEEVLRSEAVLVAPKALNSAKQAILEKLLFRFEVVAAAEKQKYITLNAPNRALEAIKAILPGLKSPTIIPLAEEGWSAVHTVVSEADFWDRIERLKAAGAEGIVVMEIEKLIA